MFNMYEVRSPLRYGSKHVAFFTNRDKAIEHANKIKNEEERVHIVGSTVYIVSVEDLS